MALGLSFGDGISASDVASVVFAGPIAIPLTTYEEARDAIREDEREQARHEREQAKHQAQQAKAKRGSSSGSSSSSGRGSSSGSSSSSGRGSSSSGSGSSLSSTTSSPLAVIQAHPVIAGAAVLAAVGILFYSTRSKR